MIKQTNVLRKTEIRSKKKEKRLEYHNQYRVGNKFPVLTPINNPLLHVVKVNKEPALTERQKVLKKANDFFGFSEDEMEN